MSKKLLLLLAAGVSGAHAANITWSSPFNVTSTADISTGGTLISAYNYGSTTSYTLNGVTFTGNDAAGSGTLSAQTPEAWGTGTFSGYGSHSVGGDYATALSTGRYTNGGTTPTVTMSGLTIGFTYQVQIWFNDIRNTTADVMNVYSGTGTGGANVTLTTDSDGGTGGTNLSQYVLGTFTADATTQAFTLQVTAGGGGPTMNMFQLRDITAIPEPSTYGLAGAGALALLATLRRRRGR